MVRARVASAIEGAAPRIPARLLGRSTSPSAANTDTTAPPIRNRASISSVIATDYIIVRSGIVRSGTVRAGIVRAGIVRAGIVRSRLKPAQPRPRTSNGAQARFVLRGRKMSADRRATHGPVWQEGRQESQARDART